MFASSNLIVVSIVGPTLEKTSKTCNLVAGTTVFLLQNSKKLGSNREIQFQFLGNVLYLLCSDDTFSSSLMKTAEKIAKRGDGQIFSQQTLRKINNDTLRSMLFVFLCSHVVIYCCEKSEKIGSCLRNLSILQDSKMKLLASKKAAEIETSTPELILYFDQEDESETLRKTLKTLLPAFQLMNDSTSTTKLFSMQLSSGVCSNESKPNEDICSLIEALNSSTLDDLTPQKRQSPMIKELLENLLLTTLREGKATETKKWFDLAAKRSKSLKLSTRYASSFSGSHNQGLIGVLDQYPQSPGGFLPASSTKSSLEQIERFLRAEEKLVKSKCERAILLALEKYKSIVPNVYSSRVHDFAIVSALFCFSQNLGFKFTSKSGSNSSVYVIGKAKEKILESCGKLWKKERRKCGCISLTGNECVLLRKECQSKGGNFDGSKCQSGIIQKLFCSCGKTAIEKSDPFLLKPANSSQFSQNCCRCTSAIDLNGSNGRKSKSASPKKSKSKYYSLKHSGSEVHKPNLQVVSIPGSFRKGLGGSFVFFSHDLIYDENHGMKVFDGFMETFDSLEAIEVNESLSIHVGLEFVCMEDGTRMLLKENHLAEMGVLELEEEAEENAIWPRNDVPIFLSVTKQRESSHNSSKKQNQFAARDYTFQLQRLWIAVLNKIEPQLEFQPQVVIVDEEDREKMVEPRKSLVFNEASEIGLYSLALPRVYEGFGSVNQKKQKSVEDYEKASVQINLCEVVKMEDSEAFLYSGALKIKS